MSGLALRPSECVGEGLGGAQGRGVALYGVGSLSGMRLTRDEAEIEPLQAVGVDSG